MDAGNAQPKPQSNIECGIVWIIQTNTQYLMREGNGKPNTRYNIQ